MIMMPAIDHLLEAPREPTTQSRDLQRDSQQWLGWRSPSPCAKAMTFKMSERLAESPRVRINSGTRAECLDALYKRLHFLERELSGASFEDSPFARAAQCSLRPWLSPRASDQAPSGPR
jgi:hypothetical protein